MQEHIDGYIHICNIQGQRQRMNPIDWNRLIDS